MAEEPTEKNSRASPMLGLRGHRAIAPQEDTGQHKWPGDPQLIVPRAPNAPSPQPCLFPEQRCSFAPHPSPKSLACASWKEPFCTAAVAHTAPAHGAAHGGRRFAHLPGRGPSRKKPCELCLLEMRITGTPPRKHFLTLPGVGPEGHLSFFHERHFSLREWSNSLHLEQQTTPRPLKMNRNVTFHYFLHMHQ